MDDKDLIYEGIATLVSKNVLFSLIETCDDKDLIYEGIATSMSCMVALVML